MKPAAGSTGKHFSVTEVGSPETWGRFVAEVGSLPGVRVPGKAFLAEPLKLTGMEIKPGVLAINPQVPHEGWCLLQGHTPGIALIKGEADSPILRSLLLAANAGIPVDMTVCISEKVATGDRWCTPISIQNAHDVFAQGHEWLTFLEESLAM